MANIQLFVFGCRATMGLLAEGLKALLYNPLLTVKWVKTEALCSAAGCVCWHCGVWRNEKTWKPKKNIASACDVCCGLSKQTFKLCLQVCNIMKQSVNIDYRIPLSVDKLEIRISKPFLDLYSSNKHVSAIFALKLSLT